MSGQDKNAKGLRLPEKDEAVRCLFCLETFTWPKGVAMMTCPHCGQHVPLGAALPADKPAPKKTRYVRQGDEWVRLETWEAQEEAPEPPTKPADAPKTPEPADGASPAKAKTPAWRDKPEEAWKQPLYARATGLPQYEDVGRLMAMYRFLGGYRDCPERLKRLEDALVTLYDQAASAEASARTMEDWQAVRSRFQGLADYRDSRERAVKARVRLTKLRLEAERAARAQALRMEQERADRERQEAVAAAVDKALADEEKRQQDHVKDILRRILGGLGVVIVAFLVYARLLAPNEMLRQGRDALAKGDYVEAVMCFDSAASYGATRAEAKRAKSDAYLRWGDKLFASGDYVGAAKQYRWTETEGPRQRVARVMALMEEENYEEAAAIYRNEARPGDLTALDFTSEGIFLSPDDILLRWSEQRRDAGDLAGAVAALDGLSSALERRERTERLVFDAGMEGLEGLSVDEAARIGAVMNDIDDQLRYCAMLSQAGFDLAEAFPDGVAVEVDLSGYALWPPEESRRRSGALSAEEVIEAIGPDASVMHLAGGGDRAERAEPRPDGGPGKTLVFERYSENGGPIRDRSAGSGESIARQALDGEYTRWEARLLPDATFALDPSIRAERWEDCEALLIVDRVYVPRGLYSEYTFLTGERLYAEARSLGSSEPEDPYGIKRLYGRYLYFSAWCAVRLFERDRAEPTRVYDAVQTLPGCDNAAFLTRRSVADKVTADILSSSPQLLKADEMTPGIDDERLRWTLGMAVADINERGGGGT